MKIISRCLIIASLVVVPGLAARAVSSTDSARDVPDYQSGEIIVKFKSDPAPGRELTDGSALTRWPDVNAIIRSNGLSIDRLIRAGRPGLTYRLRLPVWRDLLKSIAALQSSPNVAYAEPNLTARAAFEPADPYYSQQWNFDKVNAAAAWDYDTTEPLYGGDPGVVVAVLDTGVAYESYADPDVAACLDPVTGTPDCLAA
ncbi:MAG: Peptidase S8 and S53 subtilisin kexin sedolisin, partial [Candidatus Giovannonibacteria bacterium GW2011_GWA2_53_7]